MVYYGRLSQGCQRCRQRKVRCDERKPACLRCEKAKLPCPGFRDLTTVAFRDESARIIRKCVGKNVSGPSSENVSPAKPAPQPPPAASLTVCASELFGLPLSLTKAFSEPCVDGTADTILPFFIDPRAIPLVDVNPICGFSDHVGAFPLLASPSVPSVLADSLTEHATCFFFDQFVHEGPPLSGNYSKWLQQTYCSLPLSHPMRMAIESAGMSGLSSFFRYPGADFQARVLHGQALVATKSALADPAASVADATLMTVLLLALYEFVNPINWRYTSLDAHISGAATLLRLRGLGQFDNNVGANLFIQFRSMLLYSCIQQDVAPPPAFDTLNRAFAASQVGQLRQFMHPAPLGDMYFDLLHLRLSIRDGTITPTAIHDTIWAMISRLDDWRRSVEPLWACIVLDDEASFDGKRHVYPDNWTAKVWTNWRSLRLLIHKLLFENELRKGQLSTSVTAVAAVSIVRQMSVDICISAPYFIPTPRAISIIWPLSVVSLEKQNETHVRFEALRQLRCIFSAMGLGAARLAIDAASRELEGVGAS